MEFYLSFFKQHRIVFIGTIVVLFILIFLFILTSQKQETIPFSDQKPTITSFPLNTPFSIIETSPQNGQKDVDAGEITISFTATRLLSSRKEFSIAITPSLPYSWKETSVFPSEIITFQILGGLAVNTNYTVSVKNNQGDIVYSWTFTTASAPGSSSSRLMEETEKNTIKNYLPLFEWIPFSNQDFSIDYTDKLTLEVVVKNPDMEKVKADVVTWIRSKGVDPSTHTINYVQ